jgi:hypothetical protein
VEPVGAKRRGAYSDSRSLCPPNDMRKTGINRSGEAADDLHEQGAREQTVSDVFRATARQPDPKLRPWPDKTICLCQYDPRRCRRAALQVTEVQPKSKSLTVWLAFLPNEWRPAHG